MSWLAKLLPSRVRTQRAKKGVPEGVWTKCPHCHAVLYRPELERNAEVCPKCNHHFRISARARLNGLFDQATFEEIAASVVPKDTLKFKDTKKYKDRLQQAQ